MQSRLHDHESTIALGFRVFFPSMEEKEELASSKKRKRNSAVETGPFVLRSLLADVPLSAEGNGDDLEITCVEFLGMRVRNQVLRCCPGVFG